MGSTRNCIVINNGVFEAVSFELIEGKPLNHILLQPDGTTYTNRYLCIDTEILFSWEDEISTGFHSMYKVKYKNELLFSTYHPKIPVVLDVLNKYKNMSIEESNGLLKEKQQEEKSILELEIEKLKEEKQNLIDESKKYRDLVDKGTELLSIIKDLDAKQM